MKIINFYWKIYYTMPPSIPEKPQGKSDENLNIVDQSAQDKLPVLIDPQYLPDFQKRLDDFLSKLDEKAKWELENNIIAQFLEFPFLKLQFFKTNILLWPAILSPQEKELYGKLYLLAKLSFPDLTEITNIEITVLIEKIWDIIYKKYGSSRAVRNKNPWNLRMNGDLGKDKGGFAIFSTLEAGWTAFITMVEKWQTGASKVYKPTYNLLQWAKKYDPWNPNYAKKLAQYLGIPITTQLKNIPVDALAKGIVHHEDGKCYKALKDKGII